MEKPARRLKILTFNHHEAYLCSLSATGHEFDVVTQVGKLDLGWNPASKTMPANMRSVAFTPATKENLKNGAYDFVICHTIKNLVWLFPYFKSRFIFVAHIPLFRYNAVLSVKSFFKKLIFDAFALTHKVKFVAVSEFKRQMWGKKGAVIVLAPEALKPLLPGAGYEQVALVCNQLLARQNELGYAMIRDVQKDIPVLILGNNPGVPGAVRPADFEDFQNRLQRARIYLYTIRYPFGDGYNTAMLEAMKLGMAIVTVANPSSPIRHGVNGLVGRDAAELKQHLRHLLKNPAEVDRLGRAAQETIKTSFASEDFVRGWHAVLTGDGHE